MSVGSYLAGLGYLSVTWGAAALAAEVVARRRLAGLAGAPGLLARALLGLAALIGAHLLPGTVGLLSREAVAIASVAIAAAAWRLVPPAPQPRGRPAPEPVGGSGGASAVVAGATVAAACVLTLGAFVRLATVAPMHVDALSFGLPGIAEWIRTGSLLDSGAFFPLFQVRTYPNTGDVLYLATILPFGNDAFLRLVTLPLLALTGVAIYALGRELRAPAPAAAVVAALVVAMPTVTQPALDNIKPDIFMYATFAAGLVFLLRHGRTGDREDLLLAGLGIGLAFGSRWYGISSAVVTIVIWAAVSLLARGHPRTVVRDGALLTGTILAFGGFWFVRNAILTGNPIYPAKFAPFGVAIFDAPRDLITEKLGFSIADRLGQPGLIGDFVLPGLRDRLSLPALLLALGVLAAIALAVVRARRGEALPARPLALAAGAIVLAGVYAITPASAQGFPERPLPGIVGATSRWLIPSLLAAAGATAWALARAGRWRVPLELAGLVGVLTGLGRAYDVRVRDALLAGAALAALAGAGWFAARGVRQAPREHRARTALAIAAACGVVVAVAGHLDQRRYNDRRYAGASRVSDWILANAPSGRGVGIAGGWAPQFVPIYPAFGPSYGNHVRYVGAVRRGQVLQFRREASFLDELRGGDYDLLVVGRIARPNLDRERPLVLLDDPAEARWARGAGYREVLRDGQFILMARGGPEA